MLEPRLQSIADLAAAHELLDQRQTEAAAAQAALADAVTGYAERYTVAHNTHGWTPTELGDLGFPDNHPRATGTRAHRRRRTPTNPAPPTPPAALSAAAGGASTAAATTDPHEQRSAAEHQPRPTAHAPQDTDHPAADAARAIIPH